MNGATSPILKIAAVVEIATGLALLFVPALFAQQLLGENPTALAIIVGRVTGVALVGLGIACWPGPAPLGMFVYSTRVMAYLAYLGLAGTAGRMLWPAVILHIVLSAFLALDIAKCLRAARQ